MFDINTIYLLKKPIFIKPIKSKLNQLCQKKLNLLMKN